MASTLKNIVQRILADHFAFAPVTVDKREAAIFRGVPSELLEFYAFCDGAYIGIGEDFLAPDGHRYRMRIPKLSELCTTQSYGYIHEESPLYGTSMNWWQIVDYGDANWLAYDNTSEAPGRIIDVFHESVGTRETHLVVANSLCELLDRLLLRGGVYWFDHDFECLGAI